MKNGNIKRLTKGNKSKGLTEKTVQARLKGELVNKFDYIQTKKCMNDTNVIIESINTLADSLGYENN